MARIPSYDVAIQICSSLLLPHCNVALASDTQAREKEDNVTFDCASEWHASTTVQQCYLCHLIGQLAVLLHFNLW